MTFAFDFDGMLTLCPDLWVPTMKLAQTQGHTVCIATGRTMPPDERTDDIGAFLHTHGLTEVLVFYCGSKPKRVHLSSCGVEVDAWVDDNPAMVDFGYDGLDKVGEYHGATRR